MNYYYSWYLGHDSLKPAEFLISVNPQKLSLNAPVLLTFPYTRGCQQLLTICTMWKVQWLNSKPRWEVTLILPWRSFDTSSRPFVGKAEKGDRQGSILAQVTQSQCFLNNTDLKRKSWFISVWGLPAKPIKTKADHQEEGSRFFLWWIRNDLIRSVLCIFHVNNNCFTFGSRIKRTIQLPIA